MTQPPSDAFRAHVQSVIDSANETQRVALVAAFEIADPKKRSSAIDEARAEYSAAIRTVIW